MNDENLKQQDCCAEDCRCEQEAARITADQARALSARANEREMLAEDLDELFEIIEEAAENGDNTVTVELSMNSMSYFERVTEELEKYGFMDLHFKGINVNGDQAAEVTVAW